MKAIETSNNPSNTTGEPKASEVIPQETSLGYWEYAGIVVMLGLRFVYSIYKTIMYCKSEQAVVKEEESLSLSDFD